MTASVTKAWREELHRLTPLALPLLPCGAGEEGKAPVDPRTGRGLSQWTSARFTVPELLGMNGKVRSVGVRTGSGLLCFDFDGGTSIEFALAHGCDPQQASTWQVHRDTDPLRLKVLWSLSAAQQEELGSATIAKHPTADAVGSAKGEALEVFHSSGKQVLLLGLHAPSHGHYFWPEGMGPEALAPIPAAWWDLARSIASSTIDSPRPARSTACSRSSEWKAIGTRSEPCPICTRDTTGYCSQSRTSGTIRCHHGNTFNPEIRHGLLRVRRQRKLAQMRHEIWPPSSSH